MVSVLMLERIFHLAFLQDSPLWPLVVLESTSIWGTGVSPQTLFECTGLREVKSIPYTRLLPCGHGL